MWIRPQGRPFSSRTTAIPCGRLRSGAATAPGLPAGILLQRVLSPNLAQLDLDGRKRKQMMLSDKGRRARKVRSPGFFNRNVVVDGGIGGAPASQIEEPLTLQRQLQPALIP